MDSLYILTKQEFTSLYRFGKIPLISSKIIDILNRSTEEINSKIYEEFLYLPHFVGDEEYLIISFENILVDNVWLEIEYVTEIIPLTKAAKNSFQLKFDTKLEFKDARFENIVHSVEEQIDIQERYKGAKAFWNLCQVKSEYAPLIPNEIIESSYNKRIKGVKSNEFKDDFFVHLLVYERYEFFPTSDLGFFYDTGEVFAHSKGKHSFKGSSFHKFLESNKETLSEKPFIQIAQIVSESNEVIKFTEQLTSDGLKQYISSAIFLKFKSDLSERDTIKDSATGILIGEIRKDVQFVNELNLAIYLTGSFYGYKKFYDDLYELVDLKIFKKKVQPSKKVNNIEKPQVELNPTLEPLSSSINKPDPTSIEIKKTENLKLIEEKEKTEVIEKVDNKELPFKNEYSGVQKQILERLLDMLDEEKNIFELKTDRLNELKKLFTPLFHEENSLKKSDVVQTIRQRFNDRVKIEAKGKKFIISKKDNELFGDNIT
ncbi:hypothetical protein [Salinimicrobium xinjiangense]|uniref:hypothetical protein n=1 Tax=Salinimicrobium xinjiangense TaxID=438596 RepID=UPI00041EA9D4|nr:hypothetical protein [Salinimicrobium xinjiangense]